MQWLTNVFMHADVMHLLGNMLFLWAFGLVVEGKLGWWKFLVVYLGIGLVSSGLEQVAMFAIAGEGSALGASGVIYGLMAIAMMWAPKNEMSCALIIFLFRWFFFNLRITVLAGLYISLQLVFLALQGFRMSSEMLHVVGFAAGLPVGILFLKKDWVDCEGWDYISLYLSGNKDETPRNKRREQARAERIRAERQENRDAKDQEIKRLNQAIRQAIEANEFAAATAIHRRHCDIFQNGKLLENKTLMALAPVYQKQKDWEQAVPLLVEWIRRLPSERAVPLRLKLAQILTVATEQPRQAIAVLKKLPVSITVDQKARARAIKRHAEAALAEGSLEIEVHDW